MSAPSLSRRLVRLVRDRTVEDDDLRNAEPFVRDCLGSVAAGRRTETGEILRAYGDGLGDLESRVFLAAGLSHITETDDLHRASVTHPGCVVVPAALFLALDRGASGPAFLHAVLGGFEVMLRVGEALGPGHYRIFHNTATAGVFGSAAAAAVLVDLEEDAFVWVLGNAGTQAGGLWQFNEDAATSKHLHAGHAAAAGLRAALLAERGFTEPEAILEGEKGFFAGFCPDPEPDAVLRPEEGSKLPETSLKPYPSCRHTHPAIDAALELREEGVASGEAGGPIREVRIRTYGAALRLTDEPAPRSAYAAKFSVQYCVATALLRGAPGLADFEEPRLSGPAVRALMERTGVEVDGALDGAYPRSWGAEVRVRTDDGGERSARSEAPRGDPERPLTDQELDAKVRSLLVSGGLEAEEADELMRACRKLPEGGDPFPPPGVPPRAAGLSDARSRTGAPG